MAPKKKLSKQIKLQIKGGMANPAPPVGPALGQAGLNIMEFCKAFNDKTKEQKGILVPVVISVYEDRSYDFIVKTPPASTLIMRALNLQKGSSLPNQTTVGTLKKSQVEEIANIKMPDLNADTIEAACNIVKGTARSMGVAVED